VKPAPFAYDAPRELEEALDLLAHHGDDAKALAGGQSLVPLLNFRLARPARLVDLNGIAALAYIRRTAGVLRIGALTRDAVLERSPLIAARWPLLREAVELVGDPQIRARGTVGGSVAHADAAAELPVALTALGARFHVRSARRARTLDSSELFMTHLTTSLDPDELLVEIEVPAPPPRAGAAFIEHARVHGDFALAAAAAVIVVEEDGSCARASIALGAAGPTPLRAPDAEEGLTKSALGPADVEAAAAAAANAVDVPSSQRRYRRALVAEMTRRAIATAVDRARAAP
jgi:CO/xanthine dehydrogenase FAD-binding subunit